MGNGRIAFNIFFFASSRAGDPVSLGPEVEIPRVMSDGRNAILYKLILAVGYSNAATAFKKKRDKIPRD